jgi:hypothetical protein
MKSTILRASETKALSKANHHVHVTPTNEVTVVTNGAAADSRKLDQLGQVNGWRVTS